MFTDDKPNRLLQTRCALRGSSATNMVVHSVCLAVDTGYQKKNCFNLLTPELFF
jgi:hypothetical protein